MGFKDFDDVEVEIALDHYGSYFNSLNGIRYLTYDGITVHKISDFGFKVKYPNGAFDHSSGVFSIFNKFLYERDLDFPFDEDLDYLLLEISDELGYYRVFKHKFGTQIIYDHIPRNDKIKLEIDCLNARLEEYGGSCRLSKDDNEPFLFIFGSNPFRGVPLV